MYLTYTFCTDRDFNPQLLDILAAIWVVVKHLHAGFRHRICPAMLVRFKICPEMPVRVNFGVAGFKSQSILQGFGSLRVFRIPVAQHNVATNLRFLLGEEFRPIQPGVRERSRAVIRTSSLVGYPRNGPFLLNAQKG